MNFVCVKLETKRPTFINIARQWREFEITSQTQLQARCYPNRLPSWWEEGTEGKTLEEVLRWGPPNIDLLELWKNMQLTKKLTRSSVLIRRVLGEPHLATTSLKKLPQKIKIETIPVLFIIFFRHFDLCNLAHCIFATALKRTGNRGKNRS